MFFTIDDTPRNFKAIETQGPSDTRPLKLISKIFSDYHDSTFRGSQYLSDRFG